DHVVSCAGVIGIKHRHNTVRDTLVDICFRLGISAGKEVDIGLGGGCNKALRHADMLLYSWDGGLDVCVDLTGSYPLTQTGMADFVPGRVVLDVAQRKRGKYMTKCAAIGYVFLPFSFSSLGELEADAVTLLKRIRKFSVAQDIGARAAIHIFNRIGFSIAKGVFVGGMDRNVTDEHLKQVFSQYGQLVHVKIPVGKRCGFVQFAERSCAEDALRSLQGTQLGGQTVRLSWGRSPPSKQDLSNDGFGAKAYDSLRLGLFGELSLNLLGLVNKVEVVDSG
ncbi:putative reverse transcriptase domain-containing protein, partial [Tanacetum coccineum]